MPIGPWELAIILLIIVIIFGVGKLPEIGGALGKGIREFKESTRDPESQEEATSGVAATGTSSEVRRSDTARTEPLRNEAAKEEL
jgi:sec-independent protein translocase protein TatA